MKTVQHRKRTEPESLGTKIAREARAEFNKLTTAQRKELEIAALAHIYGAASKIKQK